MDNQQVENKSESERGVTNRGKTKAKRSIAKDAVRKPESDSRNGGNWVIVADKVEIAIHFNF
ncbi:putative movement protein [Stellaria aquatica mottle virus]|nr:putative movement protein [Stellaria aquatica mottle virus]